MRYWLGLIVPAAFVCFVHPAAAQQAGTEPEWHFPFDGDSLNGWTQRGGKANYRIERGQIVGATVPDTPNSFLCTDRRYADFELELDFKVDPRINSGIQIRSNSFPTYRDGVVHGYQVEIDPSERAFTAGIYDESRRGWLFKPEGNEAAQKAFRQNEWNRLRVLARGASIRTWLNDVPVADLHDDLTRSGFIGLQVHSTDETEPREVRWRNIRIRDYGDPAGTPPEGAVVLLGAKSDLARWERADKPGSEIQWEFQNGGLQVKPGTGSIVTRQTFGDCRLHVEFAVDNNDKAGQANGNSGVYIQRRYEVQILNSWQDPPTDNTCGAIYKLKAPDYNAAFPAGDWQSYDILFCAPRWDSSGGKVTNARVTVHLNGTRIHDDVEIPDKTGGGQPEGPAAGGLLLQDHGNRIRYRNIWLVPLPGKSAAE